MIKIRAHEYYSLYLSIIFYYCKPSLFLLFHKSNQFYPIILNPPFRLKPYNSPSCISILFILSTAYNHTNSIYYFQIGHLLLYSIYIHSSSIHSWPYLYFTTYISK